MGWGLPPMICHVTNPREGVTNCPIKRDWTTRGAHYHVQLEDFHYNIPYKSYSVVTVIRGVTGGTVEVPYGQLRTVVQGRRSND